ncbi:unnamed protein product, partial [Brenthis ino]
MRTIDQKTRDMKITQIILVIQLICQITKCSRVIDLHSQKGIHIGDYCPKIGVCEEGTHVICLYYDPEWDEELATFAQLWANQCILKNDMCHATKNFPEPGQTLGLIRFTIKDWKPINSPDFSNSTTLTPDKVKYAILSVLEAWYDLKSYITADNIKQLDNRVRKGTSVYTTDPPTKPGYTVRCGCPLGYDEDDDCLCYRSGRSLANNYSCRDNERCKPAVVVLPIFKVEEAPVPTFGNNVTRLSDTTNEIFDRYDMVHKRTLNDYSNLFNNLQSMDHNSDKINRRFPLDVSSRHFGLKSRPQDIDHNSIHYHMNSIQNQKYSSKRSIFSKPAIFELPMRRTKNILNQNTKKCKKGAYKKDVAPRKDFTEVKKLVSKYLENKRVSFDVERVTKNDINAVYNYSNSTNSTITEVHNSHTDTKLMKLLDKLELEVRNTDFNKNNKELFDSKIRKIYGSLIGRTDAFEHKDNIGNGFNDTDIVKKYDEILKSNPLYRNQEEFELNDRENYFNIGPSQIFRKESYRNTDDINDTETENNFNVERKLKKNSNNFVREDFRDSNYNYGNDYNFALGSDRRRFYENKLKSLQRKINYIKRNGYKHGVSEDRRLRPVRPTKATNEFPYEKPKEPINTFYMPDRARFLHGF